MKKISKKSEWYGIDVNNDTSLFEYGILVNKVDPYQYKVIYGIDRQATYKTFGYTVMSIHRDCAAIINEGWFNKDSFFSFVGLKEISWLEENEVNKLYDLISYYGNDNIFGSDTAQLSVKEVNKLIKS